MWPVTPLSMCPLERTMWNAVMAQMAHQATHQPPGSPAAEEDAAAVRTTEQRLDELHKSTAPLERTMAPGPAEAVDDLPPLSLIVEAVAGAVTERATPSSSAMPPLAEDSQSAASRSETSTSAAGSIASFDAVARGFPPLLPVPLPAPVPVPASWQSHALEIASAGKAPSAKRPYDQCVDGMLWAGAEVAGWKRHASKHGAWVDPQGKYHESATAARRKWFATPEEAEAIAKRDAALWKERNERCRTRRKMRSKQVHEQESEGASSAGGDHPRPLG